MEAVLEYLTSLKQAAKNYPESDDLNSMISDMYLKLLGSPENFLLIWRNYEEETHRIADKLNFAKPSLLSALGRCEIAYDVCDCGDTMITFDGQMMCPCGKESPACPSIVFNDQQFYAQEGRFAKPGVFNPSKHYRQWVGLILGESPFIPDEVLNQCRRDLPPTQKTASKDTVKGIRSSLKKIGRSDLSKHASAIWSRVTGNKIPPVSPHVLAEGEILFIKVLTARNHIKELINRNRIYYPYYVFKILDLLIPVGDDRSILNLIHLQSPSTLKKNDKEWRLICEEARLKYRPTAAYSAL